MAASQDKLGWVAFTEGRISTQWRQLQSDYYQSRQSPRLPSRWASGLVSSLLQITHSQWVHRNHILHEKDEYGLRAAEHQGLASAIAQQFQSGIDGLHPRDFHLIERASVRLARDTYMDQAAKEVENMRSFMHQYLSHPNSQ